MYYNDNHIVQVTHEDGSRYYLDTKSQIKWNSVTTIIGKVQDKKFLKEWEKKVGKEATEKIKQSASAIGTHVHRANELLFCNHDPQRYLAYVSELSPEETRRHKIYYPFLIYCQPFALEKKFVWEGTYEEETKNYSHRIGFGGSCDIVAGISTESFEKVMPGITVSEKSKERGYMPFVGDYKNWKKAKYGRDLFSTFLQLAAYREAVNQHLPDQMKIYDAFIFVTIEKQEYLTCIHIGEEELRWFWEWFKGICDCYYTNTFFDWNLFCEKSLENEYKGTKVSIDLWKRLTYSDDIQHS